MTKNEIYQYIFINESGAKVYLSENGSILPNKFALFSPHPQTERDLQI